MNSFAYVYHEFVRNIIEFKGTFFEIQKKKKKGKANEITTKKNRMIRAMNLGRPKRTKKSRRKQEERIRSGQKLTDDQT